VTCVRRLAIAAALCALSGHAVATRSSDRAQDLAGRLAAQRGRDEAAVPLLRLSQSWALGDPQRVFEILRATAQDERHTIGVRGLAGEALVGAYLRRGDAPAARQTARRLGHTGEWLVIGPFDNEGKAGFERIDPPEDERRGPIVLTTRYPGKERPVSWRVLPAVAPYGWVSFDAVFRPHVNTCGFATTFVRAARPGRARLWLGGGGAVRAYWNGDVAATDAAWRGPGDDRVLADVDVAAGWNRLLVKDCAMEGAWGFSARLTAIDGSPLAGLEFSADPARAASPPPDTQGPSPVRSVLGALEERARDGGAAAALDLAWFLTLDAADDPDERRARRLVLSAVAGASTSIDADAYLLAAGVAEDRNERGRFLERALDLDPGDVPALVAMASFRRAGARVEDALPWIERAFRLAPEDPAVLAERAMVERAVGLPLAARRTLSAAVQSSPSPSPALLRLSADVAEDAGLPGEAEALLTRSLRGSALDSSARRRLVSIARDRGRADAALRQSAVLVALEPFDLSHRLFVASLEESLGRGADAVRTLREAVAILPEEATLHETLGKLLLRQGRDDDARTSLETALALRPQDAELRRLLEHLHPTDRPEEAFARDMREILDAPRMPGSDRHPARMLRDLTVATVYENGLGSRFRQVAIEVLTPEAAQAYQSLPIPYDPSGQRVDVRVARVWRHGGGVVETSERAEQSLSEPWYSLYYDYRAEIVVFPRLEVGDVVEVQYRVDDVAHRNLFADYFGDVTFLQGGEPRANVEYVLVGPASRRFHFNAPRLPGIEKTERQEGDRQVVRFSAAQVPPVAVEEGMPGLAEVAAYVHVSTYRTWDEVGRWYWGLVRDQFQIDDSLRQTTLELVAGAPDDRAMARRIYDWVIENTRYVGLEFGIHGFKPYRTSQVVQRGYGDCKDKATLLVSMLEAAGVPATIVLVRTRRNGAIDREPASLAVFDHAIAYVPSLDLYLDGTAEHSGSEEFPDGDQGVMVLRVNQGRAELHTTPVLPPERSASRRRTTVAVDAAGAATLESDVEVAGSGAAPLRSRYGAEGTRAERLEQSLGADYPGARLEDFHVESLGREAPVRFRYRARIPEFGRREGGRVSIPAAAPVGLTQLYARASERTHDLEIGGPWSAEVTMKITFPPSMRVRGAPEPAEIRGPFGSVSLRVEVRGSEIEVTERVTFSRARILRREYADFRSFCQAVDAALGHRLALEPDR